MITNQQLIELSPCSNCWICEGWSEVKFEYKSDCENVNLIIESTSAVSGNQDEDGSINEYHHNDTNNDG